MAAKKTKRPEAIGEPTVVRGVSNSETFDFNAVCPHDDRAIEAELFPPIPAALQATVLDVLRTWPTNWAAVDDETCTALREDALRLLISRGLLESRLHVKNDTVSAAEVRLSSQGGYARDAMASGDTESVIGWIFYSQFFGEAKPIVEVEHDNEQNAENSLPQSPDVLELCRHLQTKLGKSSTMVECARDFCRRNGRDVNDAENLLRQAKRFRHLWRT